MQNSVECSKVLLLKSPPLPRDSLKDGVRTTYVIEGNKRVKIQRRDDGEQIEKGVDEI